MTIERPTSAQPIPPHAKKVFAGVIFDVYQWEQEMFDGTIKTFEKLSRPGTVIVYPVLPNGDIILVEDEQPGKEKVIKALAGRMEHGEDPNDTARRECREESGYEVGRLIPWSIIQPVGKIDWTVYTYIAKDIRLVGAPELDSGERITLKPMTFDELIEWNSHACVCEKDVLTACIAAKYNPEKREELRRLFDPTT